MKKPSAIGLFFSMFLRAIVVIFGLFIVGFGIFFIVSAVKEGGKNKGPVTTAAANVLTEVDNPDNLMTGETTAQPTTTETAVTEAPVEKQDAKNSSIIVLNSTEVTGLAGRWCDTLSADGYTDTSASDFSEEYSSTVIYSKNAGVGEELTSYFNGASYQVGDAPEGSSQDTSVYDIVIIIGTSDSDH